MSTQPTVSVVIPTYNGGALLEEALASVLGQTFTEYEVVVVDDGSTDDTAERLRPLAEGGRIRLIRQANAGVGAARNRGIDEARGKYVALLDHDDLWMARKLEVQTSYAERHPECAIVAVPWARSTEPDRWAFSPEIVGRGEADGIIERPLRHAARGELLLCSSSMMFAKARAEGLRYGVERRCIEDQEFHFGLLGRGQFGVAGREILAVYRMHGTNYSSQPEYWYNGIRRLRALDHEGAFADLRRSAGSDVDAFLAHFGRTATALQLLGGRRRHAMGLYFREFLRQLRAGRLKFLAATPLLACAPAGVIRRVLGEWGTKPSSPHERN